MAKNVLICGGSGLIGTELSKFLRARGFYVSIFSRSNSETNYRWDPAIGYLNPDILKSVDAVINLAGTSIISRSWSRKRKKEILESRVKSIQLLHKKFIELKIRPSVYISASAIGFYKFSIDKIMTEEDGPGKDFLSYVAYHWEKEAHKIADLGIRTNILRIGLVLTNEGGVLPLLHFLTKFYLGTSLGDGKQIMSWIHIYDLCNLMYTMIINNKYLGIYNAVSPFAVSNSEFQSTLSETLAKKNILPNVPSFLLRLILGERANLLLEGNHASAEKLLNYSFRFRYPKLKLALENLLPPLNA